MTRTVLIRWVAGLVAVNATIALVVPQRGIRAVSEVLTILLIALALALWLRTPRK